MLMDYEKLEIQSNITKLKIKLKTLDYKTNKYVEGELTETEWAEVKAQRKTYRDEINSLEEQLKQL
jgi:hypothetical protein